MSRRRFLAASAVGLGASLAPWAPKAETPAQRLGEYVDLAGLRPRPNVRIVGALVRPTPPTGWPGAGYQLESHRQTYEQLFVQTSQRFGVGFEMTPDPLESKDAVEAFAARMTAEKPDAVLLHVQNLGAWGWPHRWSAPDLIAKAGLPTIVVAPIGVSVLCLVNEISRRTGVQVISSSEKEPVEQAFRMVRARRQLQDSRVLVVTNRRQQQTSVEHLGTQVRHVPLTRLYQLFERMPANEEAHEIARSMRLRAEKIVEPEEEDVLKAARLFLVAKRLMRDESCNAITTDCFGAKFWEKRASHPCMAGTLLNDHGVTFGCEAQLFSTLSLMLVNYLFDRPAFMGNPIAETYKNHLIVAHCTCPSRLDGFDEPPRPLMLRSHAETNLGVATQILWQEGQPVTLAEFQSPKELIIDSGTVVGNVDTQDAGGCRTSVEIAMDRMEDVRDKLGANDCRHQIVFCGDSRRDVEAFCQMYGIKVINSPEVASGGAGGAAAAGEENIGDSAGCA